VSWALERQLQVAALFFERGVKHLFLPVLGPPQVREVGPYRERLFGTLQAIGTAEARAAYARMDVRVRSYGHAGIPQLSALMEQLAAATAGHRRATLWYTMVVADEMEAITAAVQAASAAQATTHEAMVEAFYGERVPPVDLFIGFGKPMTGYLMPPLLGERAACYWTTHPSYELSGEDIDRIIHDATVERATWRADKQDRYGALDPQALQRYYAQRYILGIGAQRGGFWYPIPAPQPPDEQEGS
jgi:hypothetical protein